jgi:uncharacterized protein with GYD domain
MATYVVLYKFTADGAKSIRDSVKRAGRTRQENARRGFKIMDIYWTQGPYDMVAVVDAPSEEAMMGAMMNVVSAGNVSSTTMRAFDAPAMSRILATVPSLDEDDAAPAKKSAPKKRTSKR